MSTFDIFWTQYPRRAGKAAAQKAWDKAIKAGAAPEDIIEGARKYSLDRDRRAKDIGYTAHPSTWLNAGRWQDDFEVTNAAEPLYLAERYDDEPIGLTFAEWLATEATDHEKRVALRARLGATMRKVDR